VKCVKDIFCSLALLAFFATAAASQNEIRWKELGATLYLPTNVTCVNDALLSNFPFELEIVWKEEMPIDLGLYVQNGRISVGPHVEVRIVDEKGNEVPIWFFVSMPPIPAGKITLRKGETLRFPLMIWNGAAHFPREGVYRFQVTLTEFVSQTAAFRFRSQTKDVRIKLSQPASRKSL